MKKTFLGAVAVCVGAPIVALGVAAPAAWATPNTSGPCSGTCAVGGGLGNGGINSDGAAQGGHLNQFGPVLPDVIISASGTVVTQSIDGAGRFSGTGFDVNGNPVSGTASGNFATGHIHCTGTPVLPTC
jgi:hypothetical protein